MIKSIVYSNSGGHLIFGLDLPERGLCFKAWDVSTYIESLNQFCTFITKKAAYLTWWPTVRLQLCTWWDQVWGINIKNKKSVSHAFHLPQDTCFYFTHVFSFGTAAGLDAQSSKHLCQHGSRPWIRGSRLDFWVTSQVRDVEPTSSAF